MCTSFTKRRGSLRKIVEARSLVEESVHVMALTGTAMTAVRWDIERVLGMRNPAVVAASPAKHNIFLDWKV